MRDHRPTPEDAIDLCRRVLGKEVSHIERFLTGLCHWVFDIRLADGSAVVARIASEENRALIGSAVEWTRILGPMGVPLPRILQADHTAPPFAFMLMERLAGNDLAHVYEELSSGQRRNIARELTEIQGRVQRLPPGRGYGYTLSYNGPFPHSTWQGVLEEGLARARSWIRGAGVLDENIMAKVEAALSRHQALLDAVAPTPFLHDITTKNVLIHEARLSGIVDVDDLCFGDPLMTPALTRMALVAADHPTDYIDAWCEAIELKPDGRRLLDLYTACHCASFLGEIGQAFNRDHPPAVDEAYARRLVDFLDSLLD